MATSRWPTTTPATEPATARALLVAVFLPVAFLGGLVGEMYRQFAITIAVSVTISGFIALTLTPAMCAVLLKPGEEEPTGLLEATPAQERSPFTVIGASDAAVCVDGVCSVPPQPIGGTERRGHEA